MALANWVKQATATTGTGTITLGAASSGYIGIGDAYSDGDRVYYSIIDGLNRELGVGTYTASGSTLSRDTVLETLVSGVFDNSTPTAITLSGSAVISITPSTYGLTTHAPVWKDNLAPMIAGKGAEMAEPDLAKGVGNIWLPHFDQNTMEEAICIFHINHDIMPNSKVYPHIHWSPTNTNTGTVRWGFEYAVMQRDTGLTTSATTIYLEDTANGGTGLMNQVVECTDLEAFDAPEPDSVVIARIFRDASHANDTYNADAIGIFGDLHYQSNSAGTPQKQSDFYSWS